MLQQQHTQQQLAITPYLEVWVGLGRPHFEFPANSSKPQLLHIQGFGQETLADFLC